MKKSILTLILMVAMLPLMANTYVQLADGVYQDGTTLYIGSGVTSLGDLQVNPSEIYCYATIPPACMANTFTGYGATLHVPAAGMVSYFTTLYWYNLNNILSDAIEPLLVTMNIADTELEIGQRLSLSAIVAPVDATPKTVSWSTTDASVATVSDGNVTAVAVGECDIIASCVDKMAVCHVTVVNPRVTITLDKHDASLLPNHTMTLTATCSPFDVDLAVTSSNPGVAIPRIVNGTIMVVGVSEGTATISVNAADGWGNPDTCIVTVYTEHGDVNCDGYVSIADVTSLIDYLLSGDDSQISTTNADVNKSNNISIADVTALIDYLLSGEWPWEPEGPTSPTTETFTVNGVTFMMVSVEGGTFTMGSQSEGYPWEKPAHEVTLSDFTIGETEVTQALWLAVMGNNPSYFTRANGYTDDLNRPVESVSWESCQEFIRKLNELTGKDFRLPTEAEWEFAARGGKLSHRYMYSGSNTIDDVAWYWDNSSDGTKPVASKNANELGIYDMSGNIKEWCQDWYDSYSSEAQVNPTGPASGSFHVYRSGGWDCSATYCRVSYRFNVAEYEYKFIGLRLALSPDNGPTPDEHDWVDLGLPSGTLWATCNVGANAPEEYGDYFAWGETEPKDIYDLSTYKWCNGSINTLTKYCYESTYGIVDNITELDPEDDAAWMNWGEKWRMPTYDQLIELRTQCTWTWTMRDGVNGRLVTGPNGNSMFLPAAGLREGDSPSSDGSLGFYWSRELSTPHPHYSYRLTFSLNGWEETHTSGRWLGFSVRAVRVSQN